MSGQQPIYVDFTVRDPEGRLYLAALDDFPEVPELGDVFNATDFDEFEVVCEVLAVDRLSRRVYHRPLTAASVPGSAPRSPTDSAVTSSEVPAKSIQSASALVAVG